MGTDGADVYRAHKLHVFVTEERGQLQRAQERGAIGVAPLELFAMVG
jgi:hypothetical protein